jgi:hydrogenase maturation protein HypF
MTWKIHIKGQVQGVGFRPFVWRAALERNLKGWVANGLEGVLIKINGSEQEAADFQQYLLQNAPETACVTATSLTLDDVPSPFDDFSIRESRNEGQPTLYLTPDVAMCPDCRQEIREAGNRRYRYAFTTCTVCGPRYSIMTGLPYDRPFTTMKGFLMCPACQAEYDNPLNCRYFAQTNSCSECGISMEWHACHSNRETTTPGTADQQQIIRQVIEAWNSGAVVAIKGTGGFLLTCDAGNARAISVLRSRKQRPTKPFAMMYPDISRLEVDTKVTASARKLLESPAAPIVLLDVRESPSSGINLAGVAPGLHKIGAMLPHAPLFELLLSDFGKPIVATSGNISHTPLVFEDKTALQDLSHLADFILTHNRSIVMPQDDSVVSICGVADSPHVILRRARGLAPAFIQPGLQVPDTTVLALGAEMKGTFALAHLGNVNISPYLGDLSDYETQQRFHLVLQHLTGLYQAHPTVVIGDLHPGYFTTRLGQQLADQWQAAWIQVQHHHAHFAAVLAENELFGASDPVLGVIWDGTGLGTDGQVWGGEFFTYDHSGTSEIFSRCAHFEYFPVLLGDKMAREPRLSALAACAGIAGSADRIQPKFSTTEWALYQKMATRNDLLKTSSAGRMFDAAASLLDLSDRVSYEGEAALLLEDLAGSYCKQSGFDFEDDYLQTSGLSGTPGILYTRDLLRGILLDLRSGEQKARIAAKFHFSLVRAIRRVAEQFKIKHIAFSGGVFQNTLLLDMIQHQLSPDHHLHFHQQLSPNDENISFGQWAYAVAQGSIQAKNNKIQSICV